MKRIYLYYMVVPMLYMFIKIIRSCGLAHNGNSYVKIHMLTRYVRLKSTIHHLGESRSGTSFFARPQQAWVSELHARNLCLRLAIRDLPWRRLLRPLRSSGELDRAAIRRKARGSQVVCAWCGIGGGKSYYRRLYPRLYLEGDYHGLDEVVHACIDFCPTTVLAHLVRGFDRAHQVLICLLGYSMLT